MTANLEARRRTGSTIKLLMSYRGLESDQAIADLMGQKRPTVNRYLRGAGAIDVDWLDLFAHALDVPPFVLVMPKEEAMKWVLDAEARRQRRGPSAIGEYESAWTQPHPSPALLRLVAPIAVARTRSLDRVRVPGTVQTTLTLVS